MKDNRLITSKSIFGEYKQDEDRVTAALLQILHHGGQEMVKTVFDGMDLPDNEILVETQVKMSGSRPDGVVSCSCSYKLLIESKLDCGINIKQLDEHIKAAEDDDEGNTFVVYITCDALVPTIFTQPAYSKIVSWYNWKTILANMKNFNCGGNTLLEFLIDQFELLINHLAYKQTDNNVAIVAGVWGEPVAEKYGFYLCQKNRHFEKVEYIAFYHHNKICSVFQITGKIEESKRLDDLSASNSSVKKYLQEMEPNANLNERRKFIPLRKVADVCLDIENDSCTENGKRVAFTQKQRYTTLEKLKKAKKTSELV